MKIRNERLSKAGMAAICAVMTAASLAPYAASYASAASSDKIENTNQSSANKATNEASVNNDLNDNDIIDADKKAVIKIHKYDITSAVGDGVSGEGTIKATGGKQSSVEDKYKNYAIQDVEFSYLKVSDIIDVSDANGDGTNGDITTLYNLDAGLVKIINANAASDKQLTEFDKTNYPGYYTSEAINTSFDSALNTANTKTKSDLEDYMTTKGGKKMPLTDSSGYTEVTVNDSTKGQLGLYLIVETKVPENVSYTVNPFIVSVPMTVMDSDQSGTLTDADTGSSWQTENDGANYYVECYPKNQTSHPTVNKLVRNAYGEDGSYQTAIKSGTVYGKSTDSVKTGAKLVETESKQDTIGKLEANINKDYTYAESVTASEGDTLDYLLVSKMPEVHSKATYLKTIEWVDTLPGGITGVNNSVKVAVYDISGKAGAAKLEDVNNNDVSKATYTWTSNESKGEDTDAKNENFSVVSKSVSEPQSHSSVTISLTEKGLAKINELKKDNSDDIYVVAYYQATLDSSGETVLGDQGNENDVSFVWKRTSDNCYNVIEDSATVYSYGIDLTKTFTGTGDFSKVQFCLYNETENYYVVADKQDDGLYYVTGKSTTKPSSKMYQTKSGAADAASASCKTQDQAESAASGTIFVPNSNTNKGKLVINGLEADEYKLVEIATDSGYVHEGVQKDIVITPSSRTAQASEVRSMTVNSDIRTTDTVASSENDNTAKGKEHSTVNTQGTYNKETLTLSNGETITSAAADGNDEGTTDKDGMVFGTVVASTAKVDGVKAATETYGAESLGTANIVADSDKTFGNTADAGTSTNAAVLMSIENHKGFNLPATGGKGVIQSIVSGFGIIAVGLFGIFGYKKKQDKKAEQE